jgi:hypothetical protein
MFHGDFRAIFLINFNQTLLDEPGADAPRAKALGVKNVLQLHRLSISNKAHFTEFTWPSPSGGRRVKAR